MSLSNDDSKRKKGRPKLKKNVEEEIQIAKVVNINYDFCHHCKQRKPGEVMIKCGTSHSSKFVEKPTKIFYVNNTTVVKSNYK